MERQTSLALELNIDNNNKKGQRPMLQKQVVNFLNNVLQHPSTVLAYVKKLQEAETI